MLYAGTVHCEKRAANSQRRAFPFAIYCQRAQLGPRTSLVLPDGCARRPGIAAVFLRRFPRGHRRLPRLCRPRHQLVAARHLWPDAGAAHRAHRHAPARISRFSGHNLLVIWSRQLQSRHAGTDCIRPRHLPDRCRYRAPHALNTRRQNRVPARLPVSVSRELQRRGAHRDPGNFLHRPRPRLRGRRTESNARGRSGDQPTLGCHRRRHCRLHSAAPGWRHPADRRRILCGGSSP